jgi:hypothetical protein
MMPVAYLDPSSLMVWVDFPLLRGPPGHSPFERRRSTTDGDIALMNYAQKFFTLTDHEHRSFVDTLPLEERYRALLLASTLWHEQRHFLDYVLTNYGRWRVGRTVELAANLSAVVEAVRGFGRHFPLPLGLYADPARREMAEVPSPVPEILSLLGQRIANHLRLYKQDDERVIVEGTPCPLSGAAQLEAFAFQAQLARTHAVFGEHYFEFLKRVPERLILSDEIRGPERVLAALGFDVYREMPGNVLAIDAGLISPLLMAALMCRRKAIPGGPSLSNASAFQPSSRFKSLACHIMENSRIRRVDSASEGWDVVNRSCQALWRRTVLDDLDEDLEIDADLQRKLSQTNGNALAEMNASRLELRAVLRSALAEEPALFLDPLAYSRRLSPKVVPLLAISFAEPQIVFGGNAPQGMQPVRWIEGGPGSPSFVWSMATMAAPDAERPFALRRDDLWLDFAREEAPIIQLLTDGRSRRSIPAIQLWDAEQRYLAAGFQLIFEPEFEFPDFDRDSRGLFLFSGKRTLMCEFSKRPVGPDDSLLLSPWDFIRFPALRSQVDATTFDLECLPGGKNALQNWGYWLVHKDYGHLLSH